MAFNPTSIGQSRFLVVTIGLISMALTPLSSFAAPSCDKNEIQNEMTRLLKALNGPKAQQALAAAKADLDEDQDFDNEENAKYLKAAALWHDITRNAQGEDVDWACQRMNENQSLIQEIINAE